MMDEDNVVLHTHRYVKQLMSAGLTEAQAEAQVEIFIHFISDKLVTKQSLKDSEFALRKDIKELETKLEARVKELEAGLETRMKELETSIKMAEKDITIRLGGMMVVGFTVLAAMIKFF